MANKSELAERLRNRFKGVPYFEQTNAEELVEEAMQAHGYAPSDDVPIADENLILLYAQANGAWQIALSTAHYFSYSDGEESVNKTMISEQYRKLATDLRDQYEKERLKKHGVNFRILKRADRP